MSFLEQSVSFSSNFASLISVMIHDFCTFSSKLLYALDKRIRSKYKFSDFRLLAWKLTKFLISFFKSQVNFYLDFAIPFSVMTNNFSEIFQLKHYILCTKRAHQCTIFQTFGCSFTLIRYFCWKYIKFQLKKHRGGDMSHDTEECCKIWRKIIFSFQKWQEFGEFWSKHQKI